MYVDMAKNLYFVALFKVHLIGLLVTMFCCSKSESMCVALALEVVNFQALDHDN